MYLRVKTDHSLLESTLTINRALALTKASNSPFFAVCETTHFASIAQAYQKAQTEKMKFVASIELLVTTGDVTIPVVIVCKNAKGYTTLLQYHHTFTKPLSIEACAAIVSDDMMLVPIVPVSECEKIELLSELPYQFVGLEFQQHLQPFEVEKIKMLEATHGVLCCAMNKIVMAQEKERKTLAVLNAIKHNERKIEMRETELNVFLPNEALQPFVEHYPELVTRIQMIVDQTDFALPKTSKMPQYPFIDGQTKEAFLRQLVQKGAARRYEQMTKEIGSRIETELEVIIDLGFADYFLILWDAKRFAYQNDILFGPGRGSSVGSIVAYCLGITEIDPLAYGLVFERFLNRGRKGYPDIDIDVADDKRELLITYLKEHYGESHVAHILTYGTFGAKSAFREVARIYEVSQIKIGDVTRRLGQYQSLRTSYEESKQLQTLLERDPMLKHCFQIALQIEGLKRNTSTHAAGIIITDQKLSEMLPVFYDNGFTTAWEMKELEANGFLKIDFLGLKNLSILDTIEQIVNEQQPAFQLRDIPLDDEKTYQYLSLGLTDGIFQLESRGMQATLRQLKPTQFEDVGAVLALYRPGPMESIPLFIERKHGIKAIEMPHPDLMPILKETYGVIVYQEQIMQIVHIMADFNLAEADDFRRAISKKDATLLKETIIAFQTRAKQKGYSEQVVTEVSDLMLQFANYGFVKGHAVAYGLIAYRLMYLKVHYPNPFYMTLLNQNLQDTKKVLTYVQEMKRRKIQLLPPDIILSDARFKIEKQDIRMGLCSIKGIGQQSALQIIDIATRSEKKTATGIIDDLLREGVTREQLKSLILVGAFGRFQTTRQTLVHYLDKKESSDDFSHLANLVDLGETVEQYPEYTLKECESFEREYLSYPFFQNVFSQFEKEYESGILHPLRLLQTKQNQVCQTVARLNSIRTHQNGVTRFVEIIDNTAEISAVVFDAQIVTQFHYTFGEVYHFTIKCSMFKGKPSYQILKISPIATTAIK